MTLKTVSPGPIDRQRHPGTDSNVRADGSEHDARAPPPPSTMKAIVQDRLYGTAPEEVLRLGRDRPARDRVGADEILVQVHAASVDRGTWHLMAGLPYPIRLAVFGLRRPKAPNPGRSLAGTVECVGQEVTGFEPGDEVYGTCDGSFAPVRPRPGCGSPGSAPKPANLSFEQAAARSPSPALTALQAVRDQARVEPGQKVLIIGASGRRGNVRGPDRQGLWSRSDGGLQHLQDGPGPLQVGADFHVIDYTRREDFADAEAASVRRHPRHRRQPTATCPAPPRPSPPRGRLVIVGGESGGAVARRCSDRQLRAHSCCSPLVSQKLGTFIASENAEDLTALRNLIESGKIAPAIDRTYPLSQTPAAIRHVQEGRARGKVVVSI